MMARVLGTSTLAPNGNGEQIINVGISPTWVTVTVTGNDPYLHRSEGKATSSYQHCQSIAPNKSTNETGYLVRLYDQSGTLVATAKFKSFGTSTITLKEITAPVGACQMLIEAGN